MSNTQEKNNQIIQDAINRLFKQNSDLNTRCSMLEGEVAALKAELINTKQMTAHVLGRGMGSTVHN